MIYVTSDHHGYSLDFFLRLLEKARFEDQDCLYVLGDVIDRNGDGGVAMLRWMMNRPNVELILGNHEAMLLSSAFLFEEVTDESIDHLDFDQMQLLLQWMRESPGRFSLTHPFVISQSQPFRSARPNHGFPVDRNLVF